MASLRSEGTFLLLFMNNSGGETIPSPRHDSGGLSPGVSDWQSPKDRTRLSDNLRAGVATPLAS